MSDSPQLDLDRLSRWEKIAGVAAVALVLSLFAPWYSLQERGVATGSSRFRDDAPGLSGWEAFAVIDILLLGLGVAVVAPLAARALSRPVKLPAPGSVVVLAAGALAALLIALRLIDQPDGGVSPRLLERLGLEITPFFAWIGLALAGLIAFGGWRLMGEEGETLSEQLERARERASAAVPAATAPAGKAPGAAAPARAPDAASGPAEKRRKMCWAMVGCGGAVVLGAALPWVSGSSARVSDAAGSGLGVWQGWVVALAGAGLALYGYQGLSPKFDRIRHHGWAIAAVVVAVALPALITSNLDQLSESSRADLSAGPGIMLAFVAGLAAIWPLVVVRREARADRPPAPATAEPAPDQAEPPRPAPAEPEGEPEARAETARAEPEGVPEAEAETARAEPEGVPEAEAETARAEPEGVPEATAEPPLAEPEGEPEARAEPPRPAPAEPEAGPVPSPAGPALAAPPSPAERLDGPAPGPAAKAFCTNCGRELDPSHRFCAVCGAPRVPG